MKFINASSTVTDSQRADSLGKVLRNNKLTKYESLKLREELEKSPSSKTY